MTIRNFLPIASYVASKVAAAGLVFFGFLIITGGFELYQMSEMIWQLPLWELIYGYAILFSMVVDAALYKCKAGPSKIALTVLLYMLGGYIPFLVWLPGQWIWSLIAGSIGIGCAWVFLAASHLLRYWRYSLGLSLLLLAGAIYISIADFTVTKHWTETRTSEGYRVEFDYFNGHKEFLVEVGRDQTLSYHLDWQVTSGGYGTFLDATGGTYTNGREQWISYRVNAPSTVRIVVTGDQAQGAFTLKWEIT